MASRRLQPWVPGYSLINGQQISLGASVGIIIGAHHAAENPTSGFVGLALAFCRFPQCRAMGHGPWTLDFGLWTFLGTPGNNKMIPCGRGYTGENCRWTRQFGCNWPGFYPFVPIIFHLSQRLDRLDLLSCCVTIFSATGYAGRFRLSAQLSGPRTPVLFSSYAHDGAENPSLDATYSRGFPM
jgi:hypothetical protein